MMLHSLLLLMLLVSTGIVAAIAVCDSSANETAARLWFNEFDRDLGQWKAKSGLASWNNAINITSENARISQALRINLADFLKEKRAEMNRLFSWRSFNDANLTRLFGKADDIGTSAANASMQIRRGRLSGALTTTYNTATVRHPISGAMIRLDPGIVKELADPNQSEAVKRELWQAWRDATGRKMRQNYTNFVAVNNAMIRESGLGHANLAQYWQSAYEPRMDQNFEQMMDNLWAAVRPFYQNLHAYVRRKLRQKYGALLFPPGGQIPAHILGNMWAQSWNEIMPIAAPYPQHNSLDITAQMQKQGWNTSKLFRVSEEFFTSLGLKSMTDTFWSKSVMERIPNVEMVCHASAWDMYTGQGDFRIKQCTSITMDYLGTTHHEMGHVQYFQQYEHQPVLYRRGANPGFHEAIGDTLELAVLTPNHLAALGLLENTSSKSNSAELHMNYLFQTALNKVAFLPFGLLIDKWRWRVFDGTVPPEKYNEYWWQLRCGLQGVASPVRRSHAEDFDPGAKYHVPSNTPYIRYFVSHLLQFQLYETLCNISGHVGPLYLCDFYRSKAAGDKLRRMMSHGSSRHWEDVLCEMTGTRQISADSLLKYFAELIAFLKAENAKSGERVGWDEACPSEDWYHVSSSSTLAVPAASVLVWLCANFSLIGLVNLALLLV